MFSCRAALALFASLVATSVAAQTQHYEVTINPQSSNEGYGKISIDKAAIGTAPIRLWANTSIEPDCSPHGATTLTIVHPPEHGQVNIDDQPFFYTFPINNPRAVCNQHKVSGHRAFYTASEGYHGRDKVVLEGSQPDGYVRRITVNIDVR